MSFSEILFLTFLISIIFQINLSELIYKQEINNLPKIIHFAITYILLVINIFLLQEDFKCKTKINVKYFFVGFINGILFIAIYIFFNNFIFIKKINFLLIFQCFLLSIFVSYIEELIFRFFLFENLKSLKYSKIIVSYLYTQLHFSNSNLLELISLFMLGLILSEAYQINFSLSVGIHAGIIFCLSYIDMNNIFVNYLKPQSTLLGLILLIITFIIIKILKKHFTQYLRNKL
ncbi:MAG: hypothetical protein KatS3mg068_2243 [Candidatus Sericytochromatia bacterium]|nr:MAG: hypothetical protein KatS3mg068_2243 [Candidatus Sericytochromatia bacterium]